MTRILAIAILCAVTVAPHTCWSQAQPIDTQHSIVTIRVFKSGLFSAFADNHEVQAPISEGSVDQSKREVSLVIETKQLKVIDPGLSTEKRAEVQSRMLGPEVLDSGQFPQIRFRSSSVEPVSENTFRVHGDLSLHGQTAPISLEVTGRDGSYRGQCVLKQRAFGIQPISIAGGTVKVKDEVKIEFTIATTGASRQTPQ
jgi:polyisoprenoid-binding protein YceI